MDKRAVLNNETIRDTFAESIRVLGYSSNSQQTFNYLIRDFINWLNGKHIETVSKADMQAYLFYLESRLSRYGSGLSNSYINKHLMVLRVLSRHLLAYYQISVPLFIPSLKEDESESIFLSKEQVNNLYAATDDTLRGLRDRALLSLYYGCGLRASEGVYLDRADVIFSKRLLKVRKGKNYQQRYVPMSDRVSQDLRDYMTYSRPSYLSEASKDALLLNKYGTRVQYPSLYRSLQDLRLEAGIEQRFGLHALRHSIASHLLMNGMCFEHISSFLGHKSTQSTQTYTHLEDAG